MFCGWCVTGHCCEGRMAGCAHVRRCPMFTERQQEIARQTASEAERTFAEMRRIRLEAEMTGRIRAAWAQLDVATDEIVRLIGTIQQMKQAGDLLPIPKFEQDLALEKAKARGKAEILAIIMPAPLNTPEAVGVEAGLRFRARQQGKERETPGLRMVAASVMDDVSTGEAWT